MLPVPGRKGRHGRHSSAPPPRTHTSCAYPHPRAACGRRRLARPSGARAAGVRARLPLRLLWYAALLRPGRRVRVGGRSLSRARPAPS